MSVDREQTGETGVSVLVVDDRPENLLAIEAVLAGSGYRVVTAGSGPEALKRLLEEDFAVLLLDVRMPGMDGFEVARLVKQRERSRRTPIVFITAEGTSAPALLNAYALGAVDYLVKPFEAEVLRAKVAVFAELYRERVELEKRTEQVRALEAHERERALTELRRSSEVRYRALAESIPAMVWVATPDGQAIYWNQTWFGYTGLSLAESLGGRWQAVVHPEDLASFEPAWAAALAGGKELSLELRLRRRDGAYRWHLCRARPERDAEGRVTAWLGTHLDVDEQRQYALAREALLEREREAREAAEAGSRAKDEFLASVSHELRTPLTAILGWAQILNREGVPEAQVHKGMGVVQRNAESLARMVEELLDVSRIISGKVSLRVEPLDLAEAVEAAAETVRPAAEARGVTIELALESELPRLRGDRQRLQQVAWNLLGNAVKFSARGATVEVLARRVEGRVLLSVSDSGPGLPADFLAHAFEPFRQASTATTREHGGLGLGLSIVRHLVELHGGTVSARNREGRPGAVFTVELPLSGPAPAVPAVVRRTPVPERRELPRLNGVRVLLVEDQPDAREALAESLSLAGAHVVPVGSVRAALAAFRRERPEVVLADISMPDEDGYALIRQIRSLPPDEGGQVPAAAVTALASDADRRGVLAAGFQAYLTKPVDLVELAHTVLKLGGRREG